MIYFDIALKVLQLIATIALGAAVGYWAAGAIRQTKAHKNMITAFDGMGDAFDSMMGTFTHQQHSLQDLIEWTVPPEEWGEVISLHRAIRDKGSERCDYLIYCVRHNGFVNMRSQGYTLAHHEAKRFTAAEGLMLVLDRARNGDPEDCYTLVAVPKETSGHVAVSDTACSCGWEVDGFTAPELVSWKLDQHIKAPE